MLNRPRGFSLFELVIALALASILLGVFLDRAAYYQEVAEKAAMERVAMDVRSSVNLRVAELVLENRFSELKALPSQNPMDLLVSKPQNYAGVVKNASPENVLAGHWAYDNESKEVVYYVDLGRYFVPDELDRKRIAWRVAPAAGSAGSSGAPQWMRFELVKPYQWFSN